MESILPRSSCQHQAGGRIASRRSRSCRAFHTCGGKDAMRGGIDLSVGTKRRIVFMVSYVSAQFRAVAERACRWETGAFLAAAVLQLHPIVPLQPALLPG